LLGRCQYWPRTVGNIAPEQIPNRSGPVLIVDDDADVRDAFRSILESEGYAIATVENGQEALDYLSDHSRPCVIVLDLMMPVLNGWDFLASQQSDPALATIPVVVVSSAGETCRRHLGHCEELPKPVGFDRLVATVARYCRPSWRSNTNAARRRS
jgi:CheY-like chemotaxis protein